MRHTLCFLLVLAAAAAATAGGPWASVYEMPAGRYDSSYEQLAKTAATAADVTLPPPPGGVLVYADEFGGPGEENASVLLEAVTPRSQAEVIAFYDAQAPHLQRIEVDGAIMYWVPQELDPYEALPPTITIMPVEAGDEVCELVPGARTTVTVYTFW